MPPIVSHIEIARPPDDVFPYVTDPLRFGEWQKDVVNVRIEDGPPGARSRFTTTRRIGGVDRTMMQQITRTDPPKSWAVRGIDGPIRPSMIITIEPRSGGSSSRVTFALDFEVNGIARALLPLLLRVAEKQAPTSYRNLKERLERTTS